MNLSWLTIRDLEYLVALAKHLHFAKAAEACHVSQPGLSTQIRKLEEHLGVVLFERTNRRVSLTQVGEEIVKMAHEILEKVQDLGGLTQTGQSPLSTSLRLGAIATVGPYFIPHILSPLRKKFPGLSLILKEGMTHSLLEALRSGELDVVIAADTFSEAGLVKIPLYHEPFLLALPRGHRLEKKQPLETKDLVPREMVLLEEGHCLTDQTLSLCQRSKGGAREDFQATGLETLRHLVATGAGYTLIPFLAVPSSPKLSPLIHYLSFKGKVGRKIILVHREGFSRKNDISTLVDFLKHHLPTGVTPL